MPRQLFEQELQKLQSRLLLVTSTVEDNITQVVDVFRRRSVAGSWTLISGDEWVNEQRINIMNLALKLIATQQPMATDMRFIASVIEIAGELERINDYVKGIARINLMIDRTLDIRALTVELPEMAEQTKKMLHDALGAFSQRDATLARQINALDDEVDALFDRNYRHLMGHIAENPSLYEHINHIGWALHNLERAADRVTNICEWVNYTVTGEFVELDREIESPPSQKLTS